MAAYTRKKYRSELAKYRLEIVMLLAPPAYQARPTAESAW